MKVIEEKGDVMLENIFVTLGGEEFFFNKTKYTNHFKNKRFSSKQGAIDRFNRRVIDREEIFAVSEIDTGLVFGTDEELLKENLKILQIEILLKSG